MRRGLVMLMLVGGAGRLHGQDPADFFYRGRPYGSESAFTPLTAIVASAYYTFQIDNRGDSPFDFPYGTGARNVVRNLTSPFDAVAEYGWGRFLTTEILPVPLPNRLQWFPNYVGHLLGEGMAYRYTLEWYRHHGVGHPKLLALLTSTAGALLNEVVENGSYEGVNVDPIADVYVFNPLALLLFSSDSIAAFFSSVVELSYWPRQAAVYPQSGALRNVGYHTVLRWHPGGARWGAAFVYGIQGLFGASYRVDREHRLLVAAGAVAHELVEVDEFRPARALTATFGPGGGVFLDRTNSLLLSLLVTPGKKERVALNLYPGVVGAGWIKPGVSIGWRRSGGLIVSVQLGGLPVGVGAQGGSRAGSAR